MTAHEHRILGPDDFMRMNLPREFWKVRANLVPESVSAPVAQYCESIDRMIKDGLGFVLSGAAGVGKTCIAALLAKEARSHTHPTFFVTVADLRELVRSRASFDDNRSVLEHCRKVKFLVLDALREEDTKDNLVNASSLESLVGGRAGWKLPTLITTRLLPDEFKKNFPGVMEAIRGCSVILPVLGENRRQVQQDALKARLLGTRKPDGPR